MNSYSKYIKYKNKYNRLKKTINLDFPYYKYYYKFTKEKFFSLVKNFKPKILYFIPKEIKGKKLLEKYNGKFVLIEENWIKNEELNNITDYFTEHCRIICKFANSVSPYEYWNKNKNLLIKNSIEEKGKIDLAFMRSKIYKNTQRCSNFRISVAITILQFFKAKKWLDISAGWGDRLLAAIAYNINMYCGVDPNSCLHPEYEKIIKELVPENNQKNFILIKDGFETAILPNEKFDLVFSSPPFFDLEIYSSEENDSFKKYNKEDLWFNNFLKPSLKKAYDYLEANGRMVLYMGEGIKTNYLGKMLQEINKIMKYEGKIYYFYDDVFIAKRFFVWKKNN